MYSVSPYGRHILLEGQDLYSQLPDLQWTYITHLHVELARVLL